MTTNQRKTCGCSQANVTKSENHIRNALNCFPRHTHRGWPPWKIIDVIRTEHGVELLRVEVLHSPLRLHAVRFRPPETTPLLNRISQANLIEPEHQLREIDLPGALQYKSKMQECFCTRDDLRVSAPPKARTWFDVNF